MQPRAHYVQVRGNGVQVEREEDQGMLCAPCSGGIPSSFSQSQRATHMLHAVALFPGRCRSWESEGVEEVSSSSGGDGVAKGEESEETEQGDCAAVKGCCTH